jgi:transposase
MLGAALGTKTMTVKTFEFKLTLNRAQRRKIDAWMNTQNALFNRGLALLEWREWHLMWTKVIESADTMDGIEPVEMRWVVNDKVKGDERFAMACSRVKCRKYNAQTDAGWEVGEKGQKGDKVHSYRDDCWIEAVKSKKDSSKETFVVFFPFRKQVKSHWLEEPLLPSFGKDSPPTFSLIQVTAKSFVLEKDGFSERMDRITADCAQKFVAGTMKTLGDAWLAFKKGDRNKPRYKGKRNRIRTLIHNNTKGDLNRIKGDMIRIDNLGYVKAKGLSKRYDGSSFCPMKIVKEPSGYYLQISYEVESSQEKVSQRVCGLDLGGKLVYTDDKGHRARPCDVSRLESRKLQLQKQLARQQSKGENNSFCPSKNWLKTQAKISRLDERMRRRRKAYAHYLADRVVSLSDVIVLEDISIHGMTHSNGQKLNDKGQFDKNGQSAAKERNKVMKKAAPGLFRQLLEQKAADRGRTVHYVPAAGTSKACFHCDPGGVNWESANTERPLQNILWCKDCGRLLHADINAAKNIKQRGSMAVFGDGTKKRQKRTTRKGYSRQDSKKVRDAELAPV